MPAERNALKVGTVTVVTILAFFLILIWISQGVSGRMQTVSVRFDSSPAMPTLSAGSSVLVGGQRVGRITQAELRPYEARDEATGATVTRYYVWVKADIREDVRLRADCQAIAEGPPLGGDGILKIHVGTAPEAFTAEYIEGSQPAGFAAILSSLQSEFDGTNPSSLLGQIKAQLDPEGNRSLLAKLLISVEDINAMTASMSREFGAQDRSALLAKVHGIADNINGMTASLRAELERGNQEALMGKLSLAMDSVNDGLSTVTRILTANETSINHSILNVEMTTEHLATETDASRPDSLIAHFRKTGDQLNSMLEDLRAVTSTTREVVLLNRDNIDRMLMNFKESSDHIKNGMKYVIRHPWRLFNEPKPQEMRQQAIFDAARSFAEAATRIDDASGKLRALADLHGGNIPSDSPELARIEIDLAQTREKYKKAEDELWRQLKIN